MSIHHELAALVVRAGPEVLDTIDSFRAACDDYIAEDVATRGEWNLLGDAIRLGEYGRLRAQLGHGADPATAVALHGNSLAAERGTQEVGGARWALAALGYAVGKVPEEQVLARHAEMAAAGPAEPPGPMPPPVTPAAPTLTPPPALADAPPAPPAPSGRLLLGSLITVAVVAAATVAGAWIASGDDDPSSSGDDPSSSVDADRDSSEDQEESSQPTDPSDASDPSDPSDPSVPSERPVTDADRMEVLQFAEQAAAALFARDYRDYDEGVSEALELMTDSFATEYQATSDDVRAAFIDSRTTVDVRVVASGTIGIGPDEADVLVFENQYVKRGSGDKASTTYTPYRVVLTLARDGDGWLVSDVHTDDDAGTTAESDPERAAILDAAGQMIAAFLNLDYRTIEEDTAEVLALTTGRFARQYRAAVADLRQLTTRARAIQEGGVSAAGIVRSDQDSATVIVATTGTVTNDQTDGEPVTRDYRIRLNLELVEGDWLTSDLQYVR